MEIYVRPFPDVEKGRWQISTNAGTNARWSRDGRELFYIDPTSVAMVAVGVGPETTTFSTQPAASVFSMMGYAFSYDVAADGRFLIVKNSSSTTQAQVVVVENWIEDLKARVVAKP
jgi:hypothetical protein